MDDDVPQAEPHEPEPASLTEEPEDLSELDVSELENDDGWPAEEDEDL